MPIPLKVLWASPNTLLDTANGAALMVKECLKQLSQRGCNVMALGATVFVNAQGRALLQNKWQEIIAQEGKFIRYRDGALDHLLLVTRRTERRLMLSYEEQRWFDQYCQLLHQFKPDIVLFFDNSLITLVTASEARAQGIPVGVFLMHGKNRGSRWCRDVSLMITDTRATAEMYREREGYDLVPVGTFVDPLPVRADHHQRSHILFVNPIPQKGAMLVIQLAMALEKSRPDIRFEIVDTRGTWQGLLTRVSRQLGSPRTQLDNVRVTANTPDMKPSYGRARVLLVPSLWWESGPRVIVESLVNGIPVIGSRSGGIGEVAGKGGLLLDLPGEYFAEPYLRPFGQRELSSVKDLIIRVFDDQDFYAALVADAYAAHAENHDIERNANYLLRVLEEAVAKNKERDKP